MTPSLLRPYHALFFFLCLFTHVFDGDHACLVLAESATGVDDTVEQHDECQGQPSDSSDCILPNNSQNWMDKVGEDLKRFLGSNVFNQPKQDVREHGQFLSHVAAPDRAQEAESSADLTGKAETGDDDTSANAPFFPKFSLDKVIATLVKAESKKKQQNEATASTETSLLDGLLATTEQWRNEKKNFPNFDMISALLDVLKDALDQLQRTFGDVLQNADDLPLAIMYYLAYEDGYKTPSWKRREHLWYEEVPKSMILELHDALYLAQLSYVGSLQDFREGLQQFRNNTWELVYGLTESLPDYPANFLLVHKQLAPSASEDEDSFDKQAFQSVLPWESAPWLDNGSRNSKDEIQVALVVRGTKELTDALSDALLEPAEYRNGFAHGGILAGGMALVKEHLPKLKQILEYSERKRIRLFIVGHSLGAGAGAIAAMEFNEYDFITVEMVGFGCPALLSPELSEATKDYVTTIVTDSDIVPRMSGSALVNVLMDVLEFDWIKPFLEDLEFYSTRAKLLSPMGKLLPDAITLKTWFEKLLEKHGKHKNEKSPQERLPSLLIPPGSCVHLYRDGVGFTGAFTPCDFFSSVDISRTLIDDHLIMPGYHRAMLTMMRDWENDFKFDFDHDIAAIPC